MADISSLTNLQAGDPLDFDKYVDARELPPPPRKGRYTVQAPEKFSFDATAAGFLRSQVDPTIVGGPAAGQTIKFTRISAKPFTRGTAKVSQLGDYLRAVFGQGAPRPTTPQQQADAVESTANRPYQIDGDWEAYCKVCKQSVKGEERFPAGTEGPSPWVPCPQGCKDEEGKAVNLRAQFRVTRFVAQGQ